MLMAGTSVGARPNSRICEAVKYEFFVILIFGSIFVACYLLLSDSSIPVTQYRASATDYVSFTTPTGGSFDTSYLYNMTSQDFYHQELSGQPNNMKYTTLTIPVSIP